jgi:hypothetical protein
VKLPRDPEEVGFVPEVVPLVMMKEKEDPAVLLDVPKGFVMVIVLVLAI